jgi:hypothetical protein
LPPILLVTGGVEALRDDSVGYVRKAIACGVQARVHIWQGMPHIPMLMDFLPETALAEREIFAWVENQAAERSRPRAEEPWRNAITLFNCAPFIGTVKRTTNGDCVYDPARG